MGINLKKFEFLVTPIAIVAMLFIYFGLLSYTYGKTNASAISFLIAAALFIIGLLISGYTPSKEES